MSDDPLRVAVVGVGDLGIKCIEALADAPGLELVAVGDPESAPASTEARPAAVPVFTDQRQLLGQVKPDLLVVTTPPAAAVELIRLAAKASVHVVKAAPLARTLDEAVELADTVTETGRTFAVLAPRRFNDCYRHLLDHVPTLGRLFLARAQLVFNWGQQFGWRADRGSAGGGVLLEAGYEMLDLLTAAAGVPEDVYAVTGRHGRPHMRQTNGQIESLGVYDTDDTAVVALRYGDGTAGSLVSSWVSSPATETIHLHGQSGSGMATPGECLLRTPDGQVIERIDGDDRPAGALRAQLTALAEAIATGAKRYPSSAIEHLLTMAVVEAAYLSDRTGQAESPQRLLRARDFTPERCLATRPV